ncbi:Rieske (2Fe-2S) protein [Streptomyces sp. CAU 1734]|uniref:Rieske (2Fe-2S) protein n=1 Tax=Streptomyces sp. CAU 1734 TaxID=3140360 RepID=UPI003261097C
MDIRRRRVLTASAAAMIAAGAAGCGGGGGSGESAATADGGRTPGEQTNRTGAAGGGLARTADIPVGGGKIFADEKVVVTQPVPGDFRAFSAVCTHQHCLVTTVADGTVDCPCHGSEFRIADGSVVRGPAVRPLPPERITVSGGVIRLA